MKVGYDIHARKRPPHLSLNEDLVAQARQLTDNLSAEVENLLGQFVLRQKQLRQQEAERLKRASASWNDLTARLGSLADEFTTL